MVANQRQVDAQQAASEDAVQLKQEPGEEDCLSVSGSIIQVRLVTAMFCVVHVLQCIVMSMHACWRALGLTREVSWLRTEDAVSRLMADWVKIARLQSEGE